MEMDEVTAAHDYYYKRITIQLRVLSIDTPIQGDIGAFVMYEKIVSIHNDRPLFSFILLPNELFSIQCLVLLHSPAGILHRYGRCEFV